MPIQKEKNEDNGRYFKPLKVDKGLGGFVPVFSHP